VNDVVKPRAAQPARGPRNVDRRTFVVTSLGAGFAAAVLPVSAQTITTPPTASSPARSRCPQRWRHGRLPCDAGDRRSLPTILVVSEIWGVHEHIRDVVRRFAKLGYFAIAPELFARQGDAGKVTDTQALIRDIVAKTPDAEVMADLDATVAYAKASGKADTSRLGITGFCWGGRTTLMYAAHNAGVKAAVAVVRADEARLLRRRQDRDRRRAADQGGGAGPLRRRRPRIPNDTVDEFFAKLKSSGNARTEVVIYPGTPHAFHADYRRATARTRRRKAGGGPPTGSSSTSEFGAEPRATTDGQPAGCPSCVAPSGRLAARQPPSRKNSSLGRMLMRLAIRFDSAKKAAIAPMSQMSSSPKPCARSASKSSSTISLERCATLSAKASIAFCRGVMSALR